MANIKICVVCNTRYHYCDNCSSKGKNGYSFLFDSKGCNDLWEVFNAYRTHAIDANEALNRLQQCDLSKEESFKPVWKELLVQIRSEAAPVIKEEPQVITLAEEEPVATKDEEPEENEQKNNSFIFRRKFQ